jgi:transcriptional regulator GlxA family with amidase domain
VDARPIDVTVLFLEEGHASTAVGPLEVFRAAGVLWNTWTEQPHEPRFRVRSASIGGRAVRPEGPCTITPDHALEEVGATDLVFVPSAGIGLDELLARNRPVVDFLRASHAGGAGVAGVCSGVGLLAEAGLLDGRPATTHWALIDEYRARFPRVGWRPEDLVTESHGVYCGGGVYAALDLALYLVEKLCDRASAVQCAKALILDMPRACQTGFAVLPMGARHADAVILRAEEWIHRHCREEIRFEALARELAMSPRHFIRRFKEATGLAPLEYLQRLRVRAARRLLEERHVTVQEVSTAVGYADVTFFRSVFKRYTGLAPAAYRRKFTGLTSPATSPPPGLRLPGEAEPGRERR